MYYIASWPPITFARAVVMETCDKDKEKELMQNKHALYCPSKQSWCHFFLLRNPQSCVTVSHFSPFSVVACFSDFIIERSLFQLSSFFLRSHFVHGSDKSVFSIILSSIATDLVSRVVSPPTGYPCLTCPGA